MTVPNSARAFLAVFIGGAIFFVTMCTGYLQYPWGNWRGERHHAKRQLGLAHENLAELIAKRGDIPAELADVYSAAELPRDLWNHIYVYQRTQGGFELKSYGRDGLPGGFGENTDLSMDVDAFEVTRPTPVEFVFQCATTEIWLTAAIPGLIAAAMIPRAPKDSSRLSLAGFVLAVIATTLVSWGVGNIMMMLKVGPQH